MAIISISRQVAAKGDEISELLAKKLNYTFITRKDIENRIVELGFPAEKMPKYDERKPGFFASLAKDRDEYLNYVQYAILEAAAKKNVVIIGRGAFYTMKNVPNNISIRLVAPEEVRIQRLQQEFDWNEKQAKQRIQESDTNRQGYHSSFYNVDINDSVNYHMVLNTGYLPIEDCAELIATYAKTIITPEKDDLGTKKVEDMLLCQKIINKLVFEHQVNIEFVHGEIEDNTFILQGVSQSEGVVEQALRIIKKELPNYQVKSAVSVIHDFKSFK